MQRYPPLPFTSASSTSTTGAGSPTEGGERRLELELADRDDQAMG